MKKLVFGLIAVVMIGNLSYGQEFKNMYDDFKKSTEVFYSKLNDFDKNLVVEVDDSNVFKSEESFREWLEINISKTNYKESEQALNDYNGLVNMVVEITKNNIEFLKQINDNKEEF